MEDESTNCCLDLYIETLENHTSGTNVQRSPLHVNENSNATFDIYSDLDMLDNLPEIGDSKHQQTHVVGFPASLSGRSSESLSNAKPDVPATSKKLSKESSLGQQLKESRQQLSVWQNKFKELEEKYITLNKNMLSLLLTARQEVEKKDSLIAKLRTNLGCKGSLETRTSDAAVNTDLSGPIGESTKGREGKKPEKRKESEEPKCRKY
ncbi:hypothetical protein C0Q70_10713 [Pomacea canaliculata]|uniref:Uncharacterized protein n=1 Tax=Pomacea canaliculata TaxID=400727 RepID=A0A2T7P3Y2_POMCA|nr:hypothetical protein C0Q70_10713 [Pomacea canaliculata]